MSAGTYSVKTSASALATLLATLMEERGAKPRPLAEAAGLNQTAVRDILVGRSKRPTLDTLSRLATALEVPVEQFLDAVRHDQAQADTPVRARPHRHIRGVTASPSRLPETQLYDEAAGLQHAMMPASELVGERDLPIFASAQGGNDGMMLTVGEVVETVRRPAPLAGVKGAFGMYVIGDSMSPAYEQGDLILINPAKPPRGGDDVLVIKVGDDNTHTALVKRLVKMDDGIVRLKQFNPAKEFDVPRDQVQGLHLIVGRYNRR